jgi:outer membrane protein insertion porin family
VLKTIKAIPFPSIIRKFFSNGARQRCLLMRKKYILADVKLTNKISFNDQTVVTFAGLEKGQKSPFQEKKLMLQSKNSVTRRTDG